MTNLLTSREAAKVLAISERKLWQLKSTGEIPHVRIGASVRFAIADQEEYVENQKIGRSSK